MADSVNQDPSGREPEDSPSKSIGGEGVPSLDGETFEKFALDPKTSTPLSFELHGMDATNFDIALRAIDCEITPEGWQHIFKLLERPGDELQGYWVVDTGLATVLVKTTDDIADDGTVTGVRRSVSISDALGVDAHSVHIVLLPEAGSEGKATVIFEFIPNDFSDPDNLWEQAEAIARSFNFDLDAALNEVTRRGDEYVVAKDGIQISIGDSAAFYERQQTIAMMPEMQAHVNGVIHQEGWDDYSVVEPLPGQTLERYFEMLRRDELLPEPPRVLVFDGVVRLHQEFVELQDLKESMQIELSEREVLTEQESVPTALRIVTSRPYNVVRLFAELGIEIGNPEALGLVDVASGEKWAASDFLEWLSVRGKELSVITERFIATEFRETRITFEVDYGGLPVAVEFALGDEQIVDGDEMSINIRIPNYEGMGAEAIEQAWQLMNLMAIEFGIEGAAPIETARSVERQGVTGYWILEDENLPEPYSGRIAIELQRISAL